MYKIEELEAMSEAQLRELANSMGIEKTDAVDTADLLYQILDVQAVNEAASTPEPGKRRRERIRQPAAQANGTEVTKDDAVASKNKNKKENKITIEPVKNEPQTPEQPSESEQQAPAVELPKRKRGRPSAAEKAAREAALKAMQDQTLSIPVAEEQSVQQEDTKDQPSRRRGRKPKQAQVADEPVLPFENMETEPAGTVPEGETEPIAEPVAETEVHVEAPQPQPVQQPQQPAEAREDVSLNSFFNTGSSFTFKPRTQEEREEAQRRA